MSRKISAFAALLAVVALGACETVGGAGRDLSAAGTAITSTAQDVQQEGL